MSNLSALDSWRADVSRHRIAFALLAGFVATHIATVSGYWYKIIGIPVLGWPQFNGILLLGHPGSSDDGAQQFWAGTVYHLATGISYAVLFVFLVHPLLPMANTFAGNIGKGLAWGAILATLSALLWVPRNFPEFDPGFFTNNLGWKTVLGIYVWHAVYGVTLGSLYNPLPADAERKSPAGAEGA